MNLKNRFKESKCLSSVLKSIYIRVMKMIRIIYDLKMEFNKDKY